MAKVNSDYDELFDHWGRVFNVNPQLAKTVFHLESSGNPNIKEGSPTKYGRAQGSMQILPSTARDLGITDPRDMNQAIPAAMKYIREGLDAGKTPEAAAAYYNGGPKSLQRWMPETQKYVQNARESYPRMAVKGDTSGADIRKLFMDAADPVPAPSDDPIVRSGSDIRKAFMGVRDAPAVDTREGAPDGMGGRFPVDERPQSAWNVRDRLLEQTLAGGNALMAIPRAVGRGVAEGWGDQPLGISERAMTGAGDAMRGAGIFPTAERGGPVRQFNESVVAPVVRTLVDPLAVAGDVGLRGLGAAYRGGAEGLMAMGVPRDIVAMPEAFMGSPGQFAGGAGMRRPGGNPLAREAVGEPLPITAEAVPEMRGAAVNPLSNAPAMVPPGTKPPPLLERIRALIEADESVARNRPGFVPPKTVTDPLTGEISVVAQPRNPLAGGAVADDGAMRSAGAAGTPTSMTKMHPAEAQASRTTGEVERLLAPRREGVDTTIYIPGTKPTEAEVSANPFVAAEQKLNRQQPEAVEAHIAQERHNAGLIADYYADTAGSAKMLERMESERKQQATKDLSAAFGKKSPTDPTAVVDTIDAVLADPRMKERQVIQQYIAPLRGRLFEKDGALKTDPENLYGVREHINDLLSRTGKLNNPGIDRVESQLITIKQALDPVIEAGAPGFRRYLDNYISASKPIDAMTYLQDARAGMLDVNQYITPNRFLKFMKDTIEGRAEGGINPAGHLTDAQMDRLWNIMDHLKRQGNIDIANPRGSPTSMLMDWGKKIGRVALHGLMLHQAPIVGNMAIQMAEETARKRATVKTMQRVLNPLSDTKKYPPETLGP